MYSDGIYLYNRRDKRVTLGWRPKIIKDKDAFVDDDVDNGAGGVGGAGTVCARHSYDNYAVLGYELRTSLLLLLFGCLTSSDFSAPPISELYQLGHV